MNEVTKWINIAKSDIKSSKILLENGCYSQSYFYFQQASEKANKAYWLFDGTLDENQLKKIGHNQFKPLRRNIVSEKNKIDYLRDFEEKSGFLLNSPLFKNVDIDKYQDKLNEGLKFIDRFKKRKIFDFREEELVEMLETLEGIKEIKFEMPENISDYLKQILKDQIELLQKFKTENADEQAHNLSNILNDHNKFSECLKLVKEFLDGIGILLYVSSTFRFCSILTVRHSNSTRYPQELDGKSPIDVYNDDLFIIRKQKDFLARLDEALDNLSTISINYKPIEVKKKTELAVKNKLFKIPDPTWSYFGANSEVDFYNLFVVLKNTHKDVPENIEKGLISFEKLQQLSYYHYPAYGDAFSRLTKIFEMSVKAKARILNIDLKNSNNKEKTLNILIREISSGYNNSFKKNMDWGRKMRNMNAHPDLNIIHGYILKKPLIRLVNIINDIFRTKGFFENEIRNFQKIKSNYKSLNKGLWILDQYLIHSVEIIAVRNNYSLWVFYPVRRRYPHNEKGNMYAFEPLFAVIKHHKFINDSLTLITYDDMKIELIPTNKTENIEKLKHYQSQIDSTTDKNNKIMESSKENSIGYQIEVFKHLISVY
ncbi:HEPN domain-containing protein [Kordia algicida OT-1]|uniref:HEPN domain-containing protein n=1 Tax=Kordia algicida OT-1 TaxID=391587 RepID=A9EA23_9FLAO|nr:HEPN domain-containing protein [Kordia algicida]EDP94728.1 hypothetical protein KAOT1_00590 [Kordia algicida OT-1]